MSDVDLEHEEIADRVRRTLRGVAEHVPTDAVPSLRPSQRARWYPAVAVVVGASAIAASLLVARVTGGDEAAVTTEPSSGVEPEGSPFPSGYDVATANPVFATEGSIADVASAYLAARLPDLPEPGVVISEPERRDERRAEVAWRNGSPAGAPVVSGRLYLRRDGDWWTVVASVTDGVALDVTYDGHVLRGWIRGPSDQKLFADVLTGHHEPVHNAPNPEGFGTADHRYGTAGQAEDRELYLDIDHPGLPVVVRAHLVDGAILAVSELRFDPEPLEPHSDYAACVQRWASPDRDPTPDVHAHRCAVALRGDVIASGVAGDRTWELVASDEPSGPWVTLRARDLVGIYRIQTSPSDFGEREPTFLQLGPCCTLGELVVVAGAFHPDVDAVRVTTGTGRAVEARTTAARGGHGDARHAVVTVPRADAGGGPASVEIQVRGEWRPLAASLTLTTIGG